MLITCSARRALGLLLFCLASVGTSTRMNAQPARGTVVGRITSAEDGAPIPGASIALLGRPIGALSRGDGTYRFVAPPGQYQLVVRLIGFANETRPVTVVPGQTLTVNVALKRAAATLAAIAIVGSRREERTVTTASVPIDVITAEQIKQTGRTETAQILQMLVPSLNFPRSSIAGGVDGQRPFTLRGMNPDQVLVLINGKRRHIGAVVAVNNSVGRGSSGSQRDSGGVD
jgi:iron complex outermembrane recepter protein